MKSGKLGKNISNEVEINSTAFGIWLLVMDSEYFLPYEEYPWFSDSTISDIHEVELLHKKHLYWPKLDIDLDIDSLVNPEKYPLTAKTKVSTKRSNFGDRELTLKRNKLHKRSKPGNRQ